MNLEEQSEEEEGNSLTAINILMELKINVMNMERDYFTFSWSPFSPLRHSEKKVKVAQSCPTLCDPMDYTVHRIFQARILEWVAFPFSRRSSQPRIKPRSPALQVDSILAEPPGRHKNTGVGSLSLLGGSSQPRNWTGVSCIAGGLFTNWAMREVPFRHSSVSKRFFKVFFFLSFKNTSSLNKLNT